MHIVHIEDFFHPDAGYQINILPKYMVKQGHDVTIVTSEMDKIPENLTIFFGRKNIEERDLEYTKRTGVKIVRLPLIDFISGRAIFKHKLFSTVDNLKPDILYIHGNDTLTAMRYLLRFKKLNCPIVMDSHMLDMASINKFNKLFRFIYRNFFASKIIKYKIPVIRTQNDPYVEKHLGIPLSQCPWISVGSDTLLFHPDSSVRDNLREQLNISKNDFVILYTGKLDKSKGGKFLSQAIKKKFNTNRNIVFVIVGNTAGDYGKEVEEAFLNSENRIIRCPTQKYEDLAKFYQMADLCVFPRQCSLSFYDAQACGLPVVSEDNNINKDRLCNGNGYYFKAENIKDFRDVIVRCIHMNADEFNKMRSNANQYVISNYNYEDIANQYTEILIKEVDKFNTARGKG